MSRTGKKDDSLETLHRKCTPNRTEQLQVSDRVHSINGWCVVGLCHEFGPDFHSRLLPARDRSWSPASEGSPCVVLPSGTTIFQGMVERMTNELKALAPSTRRSILSTSSQTETSSLSLRKFPVARKCCSSLISVVNATGIHDTSFSSNMKNYVYIRKELFVNVVLSSVTTMFQEMVERMMNNRRLWHH